MALTSAAIRIERFTERPKSASNRKMLLPINVMFVVGSEGAVPARCRPRKSAFRAKKIVPPGVGVSLLVGESLSVPFPTESSSSKMPGPVIVPEMVACWFAGSIRAVPLAMMTELYK